MKTGRRSCPNVSFIYIERAFVARRHKSLWVSALKVDQSHRQYFLKRPTIAVCAVWRPFKTALTVFILLHCLTASGLTNPLGPHLKLYNLCNDPDTSTLFDLDQYRKNEIIFTTNDPNFTGLGNKLYNRIPLIKLMTASFCITKSNCMNFTIPANDQYVLYDDIHSSGDILSYEFNSNPIPFKYGGPLRALYRTFPSQEASMQREYFEHWTPRSNAGFWPERRFWNHF